MRDAASERQVRAARPDVSTWLSANAGSGKTRVLTDRVARLLLNGVSPDNILCLTYTKAAASEMQNRLFKRLGEWAMKPDAALREELAKLDAAPKDADGLAEARTLFARAIETPGGLKIQTIHSFCAALLRRFPLEAQVSPQFTEVEDRAAALLRAEIAEDMAAGPEAALIRDMARYLTDEDFDRITAGIAGRSDAFRKPVDPEALNDLFGLSSNMTEEGLAEDVFRGDERELIDRLILAMRGSGPQDQKAAAKLATLGALDLSALPVLEGTFLTGASAKSPFSAKIGSFPTKALQNGPLSDVMPDVDDFMQRVEEARVQRMALQAKRQTLALHRFGHAFVTRYESAKQARGWLDFDDLIQKARDLLRDPAVAQWVLWRIDGGIDHILVDEAQDTSPIQWEVIQLLAQEFTSGQGARDDVERTIFVVGDKKQSIYSFQGADPREFDRMRAHFQERITALGQPFEATELEYSFRSAEAILQVVDETFRGKAEAGFGGSLHRAFKSEMPGRVDLWPPVEKAGTEEDGDWTDPVDRLGVQNEKVVLADSIAARIEAMIGREAIPVEIGHSGQYEMRPVRAGDILILVQRRSDIFKELIRACKARQLPIAGADRLKVGAELAVRDLGALLSFLATPEDDYSLAVVLRSPLFGWTDRQLFELAHGRKGYLWEALRARDCPESETIRDLLGQTDFLRPFDLIERILTRHEGRQKLLGRLGPEAEDGIDALLTQALAFERGNIPSLTGFLGWMQTDDFEIKRQMESAGDRIRVMTVHGSKGLEAPIVILPDTGQRKRDYKGSILPGDPALWKVRAADQPAAMQAQIAALLEAQDAESERLLYVAMTRAEKWLIVAAAGELGKDGRAWHDRIREGMEARNALPFETPTGPGIRYETGDWSLPKSAEKPVTETVSAPLDPVFTRPAPAAIEKPKTLSPSDLGGAKALPSEQGLDEDAAKRRGALLHRLLEHLPGQPRDTWEAFGETILQTGEDPATEAEIPALLAEAIRNLDAPELAPIFGPDTLAEVPITASLGGRRIHGIIDRLIVTDDHVLVVDFKTNAAVPETPEATPDGLLRQMGAYREALAQIWPSTEIRTAILWTASATLMPLPHDLVTQALADTKIP
ncbi:double-strand break repair helicase AddA [Mesobacterium pallidum]|uniref:double-strand break repair helicase AddA n=1 Tax=Mesobacterium pallidum TaxID=2872037 RepID=UPI001EE35DA9|nr:double-strand break repair helicase AddA [Mesobacterium pallidum]